MAQGSVFPLSLITTVTLVPPVLVPGVPNQSTICIVTQDATPGKWSAGQQFATYNSSGLAQVAEGRDRAGSFDEFLHGEPAPADP